MVAGVDGAADGALDGTLDGTLDGALDGALGSGACAGFRGFISALGSGRAGAAGCAVSLEPPLEGPISRRGIGRGGGVVGCDCCGLFAAASPVCKGNSEAAAVSEITSTPQNAASVRIVRESVRVC